MKKRSNDTKGKKKTKIQTYTMTNKPKAKNSFFFFLKTKTALLGQSVYMNIFHVISLCILMRVTCLELKTRRNAVESNNNESTH